MSGHTRGPVIADEGKTAITVYLDNDTLTRLRDEATSLGRGIQTQMNSELRCAPDMMAALLGMLDLYCDFRANGNGDNWDPEIEPEVQQARAAIRKATGAAE